MNLFFIGAPPAPYFTGTGPDFPDHELSSMDDAQCKAIMLRFGVTEFLDCDRPASGELPNGCADITGYLYKDHPTHWFLFIRFDHSANPDDNGFALEGYPKNKFSNDEFALKVQEFFGTFHRPESGPLTFDERGRGPAAHSPHG